MKEALNSSIHPACLQEPPLAIDVIKQLDAFDFSLYAMLSFMSCISLGLYLEQCVFIYRKLPYPKKTTIIWVTGAAPVISTMSCFGMWIPRAVMITDMTSNCYFAVVVYKVLVLLIEELGGSSGFLSRFSGTTFRINTGPCCCCCLCLPRVPMSRRLLFWMKVGALQDITGTAIWINPFIGVLTITSLWPVAIVFMNTKDFLRNFKIVPKYTMYQLVLVLSQLQTSIINILAMNGTIACSPPFSSQARGSLLSQQMMIMEMFIITLLNRSLFRRTYDALPPDSHDNEKNTEIDLEADLVEDDV
uniref:Organic solute transporter subunit alpha n=1 Tax=Mola mola TaxID=94237 RepID=A0A3Q3X114_MOLML